MWENAEGEPGGEGRLQAGPASGKLGVRGRGKPGSRRGRRWCLGWLQGAFRLGTKGTYEPRLDLG